MVKAIEFVLWVLAGAIVLVRQGSPRKYEYALVWAVLLLHLILELF